MKAASELKTRLKRSALGPLVVEVLRTAKSPGLEIEAWRDFRKTWSDLRFMRKTELAADPAKVVLVTALSDEIYPAKLEGMLSLGLRMRGWSPIFLTSRLLAWPQRYLRAMGATKIIYQDDLFLSAEEGLRCARDAETLLRGELTFRAVKNWTYQGAWIGPQLISSVARENHLGCPDISDPFVQKKLRALLPLTLEQVWKSSRLLEKIKPQMVLLCEANGALVAPLTDLSVKRGLNVVQFQQPSRDDALIFKRLTPQTRRIHPISLARESLRQLEALPWTEREDQALSKELGDRYGGKWILQSRHQPNTKSKSREAIVAELGLDPGKKIAVVFSHILWDANLFFGDDLFEDYGDWFVQTVKAACANPNVNWVIKLHPSNLWKRAREKVEGELAELTLMREKVGELPPHVKLLYPHTDISSMSLFESIDYGVTVRGTIGIELPCFGVPVFTAGTGRYSGLGFTIDSASKEEYLDRMSKIQGHERMTPAETRLARLHALGVFRYRPWLMKSFQPVFKYAKVGKRPLDHNLLARVDSIEAIKSNGDLEKWSAWAEQSEKIDYLGDLPAAPKNPG